MRYKALQVEREDDGFIFVALQHKPMLNFLALMFGHDLTRVDYFFCQQGTWYFHDDSRQVLDVGLVAYLDQVKRIWEAI